MATKDGGPAFPQSVSAHDGSATASYDFVDGAGMSLRDWFAGQALNGLLSDSDSIAAMRERYQGATPEHLAAACYSFADVMLAAREK